jgi:hypothetical protein
MMFRFAQTSYCQVPTPVPRHKMPIHSAPVPLWLIKRLRLAGERALAAGQRCRAAMRIGTVPRTCRRPEPQRPQNGESTGRSFSRIVLTTTGTLSGPVQKQAKPWGGKRRTRAMRSEREHRIARKAEYAIECDTAGTPVPCMYGTRPAMPHLASDGTPIALSRPYGYRVDQFCIVKFHLVVFPVVGERALISAPRTCTPKCAGRAQQAAALLTMPDSSGRVDFNTPAPGIAQVQAVGRRQRSAE